MQRFIFTLALALAAAAAVAETQVRLVLDNGRLVKGTLVGQDAESVVVENDQGRAVEIPRSTIRKAFDAAGGRPLDLGAAPAAEEPTQEAADAAEPEPTPEPTPTRRAARKVSGAEADYVWVHRWVELGLHFSLGYNTGDDTKIRRLWEQLVPSNKLTWSDDSNRFTMNLGLDGLVSPWPWLAVGPFVDWQFYAPGANGELQWTSSGYAYWNGYYWVVYPSGRWTTRHELSFDNVAYGARLRGRFPIAGQWKSGSFSAGLDLGQISLSGAAYRAWMNDSLVQELDLSGNAPYAALSAGIHGPMGPHSWVSFDLAYQWARINAITGFIKQNSALPSEEGTSGTIVDTRDRSNIYVDLSGLRLDLAMGVAF